MIRTPLKLVAAAFAATSLSACAYGIAPRPDLVAAGVAAPVVDGKATLVMSPDLINRTISAHPTSLTGSATSLNVPMGQIVRATGEKVLGAGFSGGVMSGASPAAGSYAVKVGLDQFSYAYDQASSLGFAITPKVTVGMTADVQSPEGKPIFRRSYSKADYTAGKYVVASQPHEKINEGLHLALGQMFRDLLDDIAAAVKSGAPSAAAGAP